MSNRRTASARRAEPDTESASEAARPAPKRPAQAPHHRPSPFRPEESPLPRIDDLEDLEGPPIHGKAHPRADMDDAQPSTDDSVRNYHHHPNEAANMEFSHDPYSDDAAADLAGDLGAEFLEGATRGRDMSDIHFSEETQAELPFLVEEDVDARELPEDAEELPDPLIDLDEESDTEPR